MPQHPLDYRRLTPAQRAQFIPGYETMSRQSGGVADAGMLARHEHRAGQRGADPPAGSGTGGGFRGGWVMGPVCPVKKPGTA
jgi:hypothetical protein